MMSEILFVSANDTDLNSLLKGKTVGIERQWHGRHSVRVSHGEVGVLCKQLNYSSDLVQPLALIVQEAEYRRLFGRIAQVRSEFSPLSAWCHILTPERFESLDEPCREANVGGFDAAWTGLVVAEALLLSQLPISKLKIAACLATQTFAIARGKALWNIPINDSVLRYDQAQQLFRTRESRSAKLRSALHPIWNILSSSASSALVYEQNLLPLVRSIQSLLEARSSESGDEAARFCLPLMSIVPEAEVLMRLPSLTPEQRVREFDKIIAAMSGVHSEADVAKRHAYAMVAGYYATIAAGGAPSLSLLDSHNRRWPEIMAWAYVLGSIGERIIWTSSFDGLGRLVARELMRPFRLDEAPTCDFTLDEAFVLVDSQLTDPLVHLRIKQSRIVTVGLLAGVNILVSMGDQLAEHRETDVSHSAERSADKLDGNISPKALDAITETVFRRLRGQMERYVDLRIQSLEGTSGDRPRTNKRQSKLPFKPDEG